MPNSLAQDLHKTWTRLRAMLWRVCQPCPCRSIGSRPLISGCPGYLIDDPPKTVQGPMKPWDTLLFSYDQRDWWMKGYQQIHGRDQNNKSPTRHIQHESYRTILASPSALRIRSIPRCDAFCPTLDPVDRHHSKASSPASLTGSCFNRGDSSRSTFRRTTQYYWFYM